MEMIQYKNIIQETLTVENYLFFINSTEKLKFEEVLSFKTRFIPVTDISPDQNYILVSQKDFSVVKIDFQTKEIINRFVKHTEKVTIIQYSIQGDKIATGSNDQTVIVWDEATAQIIYTFDKHQYGIKDLKFISNNKIVTLSKFGQIFVIDFQKDQIEYQNSENQYIKSKIEISDNYQYLAIIQKRDYLIVLNLQNYEIMLNLNEYEEGDFQEIQFSPNGEFLILILTNNQAQLWNMKQLNKIFEFNLQYKGSLLKFSSNGQNLFIINSQKNLIIFNLKNTFKSQEIQMNIQENFTFAVISSDSKYLFLANIDKQIQIWDIKQQKTVRKIQLSKIPLRIILLQRKKFFCVICESQIIIILSSLLVRDSLKFQPLRNEVSKINFFKNSEKIMVLSDNRYPIQSSSLTGQKLLQYDNDKYKSVKFALSPDNLKMTTIQENGQALIWDVISGDILVSIKNSFGEILQINYSHDAKLLATGYHNGKILVIDSQTNSDYLFYDHQEDQIDSIIFSKDNKYVASKSKSSVIIYDLQLKEMVNQFVIDKNEIGKMDFSENSQLFALTNMNLNTIIYDLNVRQIMSEIVQQQSEALVLKFSPDNNFIFISAPGICEMHELENQKSKKIFYELVDVIDIQFSPDLLYIGLLSKQKGFYIYDYQSQLFIYNFCEKDKFITQVDFAPNGISIGFGYSNGEIEISHLQTIYDQSFHYYFGLISICIQDDQEQIEKILKEDKNIYDLGIFDLNLLQFVIITENRQNIKKVLQCLINFDILLHICNLYYHDIIIKSVKNMKGEIIRLLLQFFKNFNNQKDFCQNCNKVQNQIIQYCCLQKIDIREILDSLLIEEKFNQQTEINENAQVYLKVHQYGKKDSTLLDFNCIVQKNIIPQLTEQNITFQNRIENIFPLDEQNDKQKLIQENRKQENIKQICYFHFLGIDDNVELVKLVYQNYRNSNCEVYKSLALFHIVNQQFNEYGFNTYLLEGLISLLNLIVYAVNLIFFQSFKIESNFSDIETYVLSTSLAMNIFCLFFSFYELRREFKEYQLDIQDNFKFFNDIWNLFDLSGIISQIINISLDFYLTYENNDENIKIVNSFFAICALFFQMISNIKYLRVSNKFSSLIQLVQKVIKDLRQIIIIKIFLLSFNINHFRFFFYFLYDITIWHQYRFFLKICNFQNDIVTFVWRFRRLFQNKS